MSSFDNPNFIDDGQCAVVKTVGDGASDKPQSDVKVQHVKADRDKWGKDIEFLFSCIALSVGLGNVWRFPFTAMENGGGAFVLPYIVVLFLIGRPIYYMEMVIGQFSSRGSIKVFDISPAMRGIGIGQVASTGIVATYYASLMALTIRYFFISFQNPLPWSQCSDAWTNNHTHCINSSATLRSDELIALNLSGSIHSSAELFFINTILKEADSIDDGIGMPNWPTLGCLALAWTCVTTILIKGIRSSGKASYFLALFPYLIMLILLIRSVTLPGAWNGIAYFLTPQWNKILEPKVWYAAVTQVFFSLTICFGNIIMYSSYNRFSNNIYRDSTIVTTLDTFTSILAGCITFGILGHLAEVTGTDVQSVAKGDIAFMTYPDAIAKFKSIPQVFSLLFFFMLFVLGMGSNVGMANCVMTAIRDQFPRLKHWAVALGIAGVGFCVGSVYTTPGGQYMLQFMDFYGASFIAFMLAIAELVTIAWIYGVDRLCKDIEFMLNIKTGYYFRICWKYITPITLIIILSYSIVTMKPLTYKDRYYPNGLYAFGWTLSALGILQLPIWAVYAILKQKDEHIIDRVKSAFRPMADWGPSDPVLLKKYQDFITNTQR